MWSKMVPVVGRCRACGEEIGTELRLRATPEWHDRYEREDGLRRRVDGAIVRLIVARHERRCAGRARRRMTA